ncbi:hypothetical protein E5083_24720 [Streptomyces bauhiniae]|uniref:Uncharacterized protein n=1 Tax=Streptomyces bauhiniae TaxID=2340725 RepID=A0A4Z1CY88_9ACTN|nr:hypothetical protein [Streptomyces bauhiniae]TGN73979.1 hypothetical protein E5083_24720 [Streptomyces bauhiniae]
MTDWSKLSHAYGSAEDIPALLDRIASEPKPDLWSDLWSALCHQGSVYPASFAALPWLADVADSDDREQAVNALTLAGAIMAGAEQPHGAGDVRTDHAVEVETLLAAVNQHLRVTSDRTDYIHLLEAMLGFEGVVGWSEDLAWGLGNEEYEVDCPGCEAGLFIVLGERGFFSTSEDYALSVDDVEGRPLLPANPADLGGIGRRLHEIAVSDSQHEVAHALTYVFGHATCPDCETHFSVADQVSADWSATQ